MEENKTRTVSSLKSEDSTERLICATPRAVRPPGRGAVAALAVAQVVSGALLMSAGAAAVLRGANMSRAGGGLWAGTLGLLVGLVGLLAALTDKPAADRASPLLTTFVALSVASLASGSSAALLAATGVKRDLQLASLQDSTDHSFQEEMAAWSPVLANIAVLSLSCVHWLLSIGTVALLARRVCLCFSPGNVLPPQHNQFDPNIKTSTKHQERLEKTEKKDSTELCGQLEGKLTETEGKISYGSAGSKEKLVNRWLGGQAVSLAPPVGPPRGRAPRGQAVVLLPAHNTTTFCLYTSIKVRVPLPPDTSRHLPTPPDTSRHRQLQPAGRVRMLVPPHYATLPPAPARTGPTPRLYPRYMRPPPAPAVYYPVHDNRGRRRRRAVGNRAARRAAGVTTGRQTQLTRSLERIHRKRDKPSDNDLRQTYTGLDRTYADQYIAVCDESRSHAAADTSPSLTSVGTDSHVRRDSF